MEHSNSRRNPVEELAEEFTQRRRCGERPTIEEYARKYPQWADDIRDLFPALQTMENVRDDLSHGSTGHDWGDSLSRVGEQLGDYRILREIARGGMGVVYEADQESLGRRVALKVLAPQHVCSSKYLERFKREARAAANLQHTNIVPVFGVGEEQGVHYYVMQYIRGRGIDEVLAALPDIIAVDDTPPSEQASASELARMLSTGHARQNDAPSDGKRNGELVPRREDDDGSAVAAPPDVETTRLSMGPTARSTASSMYHDRIARLGMMAADALQYAHGQGVLHRDIKPSNLLLDLSGNVWITDFGLAKIEGEKDLTRTGDVLGTLRYIAPESLQGRFDGRTDIYGLGLTLYELVARRQAFAGSERGQLIRQISEEGPESLVATSVPNDLATIVHKAIERDPKYRYASAAEMAEDLRRFVHNEPILARRISPFSHLLRWARRNPALAFLATAVTALLVIGLIGSTVASIRISALATERQAAFVLAKEESNDAKRRLVEANIVRAEGLSRRGRPGQRLRGLAAVTEAVPIARELQLGEQVIGRLRDAAIACLALPDLTPTKEWHATTSSVDYAADVDPTLQLYAFQAHLDQPIKVRRVADHREIHSFDVKGGVWNLGLRFSNDHRFLAAKEENNVHGASVHLWDLETGRSLLQVENITRGAKIPYAFANDSSQIAVALASGDIRIFKTQDASPFLELPGSSFADCLCFAADGSRLFVCRSDGNQSVAKVYDLSSLKCELEIPLRAPAMAIAINPQGSRLAIATAGELQIYNSTTGVLSVSTRVAAVRRLEFHPDGNWLAGTEFPGPMRLWDARSGSERIMAKGGFLRWTGSGNGIAYRELGRIGLWRFTNSHGYRGLESKKGEQPSQFHPDGRIMVTPRRDGLWVWDAQRHELLARLAIGPVSSARFTRNGADLFTVVHGRRPKAKLLRWPIRRMDTNPTTQTWELGPPVEVPVPVQGVHYMDMDATERILAMDARPGKLVVLDLKNEREPLVIEGPPGLMFIKVSRDGNWAATGNWHGRNLAVYDLRSAECVHQIATGMAHVAFSPDNKYLLYSGHRWRKVELGTWDSSFLTQERIGFDLQSPRFPISGRFAAFGSYRPSQNAFLMDPISWHPLARLQSPLAESVSVSALSPDGSKLVVEVQDQQRTHVDVWDLRQVRNRLAELGLDWNLSAYPEEESKDRSAKRIEWKVDWGELARKQPD